MTNARSLNPTLPTYLWHLLPLSELYKLDTFLRCGLWCAESSTIPTFEGDIEDKLPYGYFMSCWHMNYAPSLNAWEIFAGNGHGLALRTDIQAIQNLTHSIHALDWKIDFSPVDYVDTANAVITSPFAVAHAHTHENEARLVISVQETKALDNSVTHVDDSFTRYLSRDQVVRYDSISIVGRGKAEAIVLSIDPAAFIQEILIGWLVTDGERIQITRRLDEYGVADKLHIAQRPT